MKPIVSLLMLAVAFAALAAGEGPRHWAYVVPLRPVAPTVRDARWPKNDLDRFVMAKLERVGRSPSPEANRETLIRRASFDLVGLPPTPGEVAAFVLDPVPSAYDRLIDRLLASPQFGERWARPWLDLARYADSHGFQRDDLRDLWPYRDWVVRALNADLPFDDFTIQQLAGDLLPEATVAERVATGFHRCAPVNVEAGSDREQGRVNQVFDRVNTTATVWLGTTLECAQCHDHKYDPYTMRDYYRMFAFFNNTPRETEYLNAKAMATLKFVGPYLTLPGSREAPTDEQGVDADDTPGQGRAPKHHDRSLVMQELVEPRMTRILMRGDFLNPGEVVSPGAPAVLPKLQGSNRLALARWLVSGDNPLTARVTVNRWWAELFGAGLVGTAEDFGVRGEAPTHHDLLDWLAVEFVEHRWSFKQLLRLIVTSAVYRQDSRFRSDDPENRLLGRGPRHRLEAEAVRDNALAIAGLLSLKQGGPPVRPPQPPGLWTKVGGERYDYVTSGGEDRWRRGLYIVWRRSAPYPSFVSFDSTARTACTVRRGRSNTPLQALTLLNDPVYVEAAQSLAQRMLKHGGDEAERLAYGFRMCVARAPRPGELAVLQQLLKDSRAAHAKEQRAWTEVATALLNLDETISKS